MKRMLPGRLMRTLPAILLVTACYCGANAQSGSPQKKPAQENTGKITLKELLKELHDKRNMSIAWNSKNTPQASLPASVLQQNDQQIVATITELLQKNGLKLTKTGERQFVITEDKQEKPVKPSFKEAPQEFQLSGTVRDPLSQPMPNVSITQLGSLKGTISDSVGGFRIVAAKGDSIRFEHMGFAPQTIVFKDRIEIDIVMEATAGGLNEVVVIGFGKQKKVSQVGAQSTVNVEELKQPVANLNNVIAGRLAGIIGVQRSGEPGYDNANIWIRGISTFTNSGPLVLVDGIERNFSYVDPEDISSFSILKDASATAVYGVRGANGVILIQTKKGKAGKPQINLQYNQGVTAFTKRPEFVDGPTYLKLANEAYANSNPNSPQLYSDERIKATADGTDPDLYPNVNWMDEMFHKTGQNRRANANVTGGSQNAKYYLSIGYYDEQGLFKTDDLAQYNSSIKYKRFNFTSNLSLDITPSTKLDFGASGWISIGNFPGTGTGSIWDNVFLSTPVSMPAMYSNGYAPVLRSSITSPYVSLTQTGYARDNKNQLWSNIRLTQDLGFWLKGLSATAMYSFDAYNAHTIRRTKTVDGYIMTGRNADGTPIFEQTRVGSNYLGYSRDNGGNRQFYTEASINYNNRFGKHDVSGMVLFNRTDYENAFAGDFISAIPFRNQGLAGRATYGYDTRYLLEVNFGYNGAENFAPNKRYGFFPSFGLGWVASNEAFFKPLSKAINFLKFRGSWGKVGNNKISDSYRFGYIAQVGGGSGGYAYGRNNNYSFDGFDISEYAVDVSWERATKTNIGIELKTLRNALSVTVDYFLENREGIFLRRSNMPYYVGLRNNPYGNFGVVHNKGVDGTIEYNKSLTKSLSVGFRGNFTWNRAIIIDDANAAYPFPWQQRIGRKMGQRFGYTALGLFEDEKEILNSPAQTGTVKPGDIKFKDLNGDGRIDAYDQGPIGYGSIPELVYGVGGNINWKGFSIGAFFKGLGNVDISLNGEGFQPFQLGGDRGNLLTSVQDRWTPDNPNPNATYPRLTYPSNDNMNYENSTWWVKNGSFLRLQSMDASYNLPKRPWMTKAGLGNVRIYFIGYNVATFSSFKMWDVELGDGKGATYPLIKSFNMGLELRFK
jgi:TonB-linked SusC/RagA family outer membrane protein